MYEVTIEKQCGCFKRSGEAPTKSFASKDAALEEAVAWSQRMNEEYCRKHVFAVREEGESFVVGVEMRS